MVALSLHEPEVEAAVVELVARHPILADTLFTRLTQAKDAQTRGKHHVATVSRVAASEEERIVETHRVFPIGPMIAMLGCAGAFAFISNVSCVFQVNVLRVRVSLVLVFFCASFIFLRRLSCFLHCAVRCSRPFGARHQCDRPRWVACVGLQDHERRRLMQRSCFLCFQPS